MVPARGVLARTKIWSVGSGKFSCVNGRSSCAVRIFRATSSRCDVTFRSSAQAIKTDFDPRVVKVFEENIRRSAATVELEVFKGLFVLQPVIGVGGKPLSPKERLWADSDIGKAKIIRRKEFYKHTRPLMAKLDRDYANDKSLCFTDMSRVLKDVKERAYVDEGHLDSNGNRIVAQAVITQLVDCGFLPLGIGSTGS